MLLRDEQITNALSQAGVAETSAGPAVRRLLALQKGADERFGAGLKELTGEQLAEIAREREWKLSTFYRVVAGLRDLYTGLGLPESHLTALLGNRSQTEFWREVVEGNASVLEAEAEAARSDVAEASTEPANDGGLDVGDNPPVRRSAVDRQLAALEALAGRSTSRVQRESSASRRSAAEDAPARKPAASERSATKSAAPAAATHNVSEAAKVPQRIDVESVPMVAQCIDADCGKRYRVSERVRDALRAGKRLMCKACRRPLALEDAAGWASIELSPGLRAALHGA